MLIDCPTCRNKISVNAATCPKCGEPLTQEYRQKAINKISNAKKTFAVIVIIFLFLVVVGNLSRSCSSTPPSSTPPLSFDSKNEHAIDTSEAHNYITSLDIGGFIFIVGKEYLGDTLLRVIDSNFSSAVFSPDQSIKFYFKGSKYIIQTEKVNYTGQAYYRITSILTNASQQPGQQSEPSLPKTEPPPFNEELIGIKYVMTIEDGNLFCYVNDSWNSVPFNIKKKFVMQIGKEAYFGKTDFILRNSKGKDVAEYNNGTFNFPIRR